MDIKPNGHGVRGHGSDAAAGEPEGASSRPLITFFIYAYCQEAFIREAVQGAFAQTYSPLEIILSDDASPDRTHAILQEMAAEYRGPHEVRVNRNPVNLGVTGHINRLMGMARGELVVVAGGDDISLPARTEVLHQAWIQQGQPSGIASRVELIDAAGRLVGGSPAWIDEVADKVRTLEPAALRAWLLDAYGRTLLGSSAAWARRDWERFGELDPGGIHEDKILTFRAALLRGMTVVPDVLVRYRRHGESLTNFDWLVPRTVAERLEAERAAIRRSGHAVRLLENHLKDVSRARHGGLLGAEEAQSLMRRLEEMLAEERTRRDWWDLSPAARWRRKPPPAGPLGSRVQWLLSLLPLTAFAWFITAGVRLKRATANVVPVRRDGSCTSRSPEG